MNIDDDKLSERETKRKSTKKHFSNSYEIFLYCNKQVLLRTIRTIPGSGASRLGKSK